VDWHYLVLGLVQGLTEFLPVSSSGHLLLFERQLLSGISDADLLTINVFFHAGTLIAVLFYFRERCLIYVLESLRWLRAPTRQGTPMQKEVAWIIVLTLPTGALGLGLKKAGIAQISVEAVLAALVLTGIICLLTDFVRERNKDLGLGSVLALGVVQGLAVVPGISRSGSTILAGMACGLSRERMASFSFLMSIPAISGAVLLESIDLMRQGLSGVSPGSLALGTLVASISGYLSLIFLISVLKKRYFRVFGVYCFGLVAVVSWLRIGG